MSYGRRQTLTQTSGHGSLKDYPRKFSLTFSGVLCQVSVSTLALRRPRLAHRQLPPHRRVSTPGGWQRRDCGGCEECARHSGHVGSYSQHPARRRGGQRRVRGWVRLPYASVPGGLGFVTARRNYARLRREELDLRDDLLRLPLALPVQLDDSGSATLIVLERDGVALARR